MKLLENIVYKNVGSTSLALDIYLPDSQEFSVFVYFHGGGLEAGDKDDARELAETLAGQNIATVSAQYRKYPSAKYPEFIEDAAEAVIFVVNNIGEYGRCDRIYVGGSSAGGYLSMMLCFDDKYLGKYGIKPTDIAGFVHDAGQPTAHFNVLRERGIDPRRVIVDESAPLYHICEKDYSPMLFINAEFDMKNRHEQTMLTLSTLRHFGKDDKISYKLMESRRHCAYVREKDEKGNSIFGSLIAEFIRSVEK